MFIPKEIVFSYNDKTRIINFSNLRKPVLTFITLWAIILLCGSVAKLGITVFLEHQKLNDLKAEYKSKRYVVETLKTEYNRLALAYIDENKIARIVKSVNQWLSNESIDLWVNTIRDNGSDLYAALNEESKRKLNLDTNQYSLNTGSALILAIAALESDFKLSAMSHKGAYGPMQLRRATALQVGLIDRRNPAENIRGGAIYLKSMLKKYSDYPDQLELALASYNAGATRVKRDWISTWGDDWNLIHTGLATGKRFKETRDYVKTIIAMTRLFTSGVWSDLGSEFWSDYRNIIFQPRFFSIYEYDMIPEHAVTADTEGEL